MFLDFSHIGRIAVVDCAPVS